MNQSELLQRMKSCSILNEYEGLSDLERHLHTHPCEAADVAWAILCHDGDPGKDDHALCENLTSIWVDGFGNDKCEKALIRSWNELSPEIRENIIYGFSNTNITKMTIMHLYGMAKSEVADRHRILSIVASSRLDEFRNELKEMILRVGAYEDSSRQDGLDRLVANLEVS